MNNVKKIAAAVAVAIGTAGSGVVQSDIYDFGYGVSSATVATVLSVVNLEDESGVGGAETLHFRYFYKAGANATNNAAVCEEVDFTWSTSPNDLVTVSPDEHFGSATRGILFNDPASAASYAPAHINLGLLRGITQPIRFKTFIDNNGGKLAQDNTLTAGRATIIEFINGAAWGYQGYNPSGNSFSSDGGFSEMNEVFGEVLGPNGPSDGVDVAIKPFDEIASIFFVQPISHYGNVDDRGNVASLDQDRLHLEARVTISVADYTGRSRDAMFDRDENPISANVARAVTCVGAVTIQQMLSSGAVLLLEGTGGWGEFKAVRIGSSKANTNRIRTEQIVAEFLEHNDPAGAGAGGTFAGEPVGGVINNGYSLLEN